MAVGAWWKSEADRWPLWLPVALGAGSGLYFALPFEPPALLVWGAVALGLGCIAAGARAAKCITQSLILAAALCLGFAAAKARTEYVSAPILPAERVVHFTARVAAKDPAATGVRLLLTDARSGAFTEGAPKYIRVAVRQGGEAFHPGDGIGLTAQLAPPPGPSEPGDGDFARAMFFQGIGAVGFSYGAPLPAPLAQDGFRTSDTIENLRENMTARIQAVVPGSTGAIASALITGQRGGIEPRDDAALRDAGLAHVLSISGLHMAMVGFGIFWLVRAILAAFPVLALNYPIKKYAALVALAGAFFYLVISGLSAPANRSFVMLAMMLLAILVDRPALTMRNLAWAAGILILWRPDSITEPGFQMSFAAVAGLIAVAEWEAKRQLAVPHGMVFRYLRGIAITSFVGSMATMPFALFYFERANHYAVLGNLLAMPVVGFVVMPAAALGVAAMPFGLESLPLAAMGWGLDVMIRIGHFVAGLPGVVSVIPAFPMPALLLVMAGGLGLVIWRGAKRWLGFVPMALAVLISFFTPRPDILVASDGVTVAVRGADKLLTFPRPPKDKFAASRWLVRDGDTRNFQDAVSGRCDAFGCTAQVKGQLVALPQRLEALPEDCARADIVISAIPIRDCKGPKLVLDSAAIAQGGGYAITGGKPLSVRQSRGARPWVR